MILFIRGISVFLILYSAGFYFTYTYGFSGSRLLVNLVSLALLISAIGMIKLKGLFRYVTIIIMLYISIRCLGTSLYIIIVEKGNVGSYLLTSVTFMEVIIPLVIVCFLLIPKVKEQFK